MAVVIFLRLAVAAAVCLLLGHQQRRWVEQVETAVLPQLNKVEAAPLVRRLCPEHLAALFPASAAKAEAVAAAMVPAQADAEATEPLRAAVAGAEEPEITRVAVAGAAPLA